jgi:hypothetical protein
MQSVEIQPTFQREQVTFTRALWFLDLFLDFEDVAILFRNIGSLLD